MGDEDIKVIERSPEALWQDFLSGELVDAKTIIGLLWLRTRSE